MSGRKSGVKYGRKSGVKYGMKYGIKYGIKYGMKSGIKSGIISGLKSDFVYRLLSMRKSLIVTKSFNVWHSLQCLSTRRVAQTLTNIF